MRAAIRRIFRSNLAIKDGERILLVTDDGKHAIARRFLEVAEELGHAAELATVPIPEVHGVEPPAAVARKMLAKYADDPRVNIRIVNNTNGLKNAKVVTTDPIEFLDKIDYTDIGPKLRQALDQEFKDGKISEEVYRNTAWHRLHKPSE